MSEAYTKLTGETMMTVPQTLRYRFVDNVDAALSIEDRTVEVDSASEAVTITLPSVIEACGLFISIVAVDATSGVTIEDLEDDAGMGDFVMTVDGDYALMYSDGARWIEINCGCGLTGPI